MTKNRARRATDRKCFLCFFTSQIVFDFEPQSATEVSGRATSIQPLYSIPSRESWENDKVGKKWKILDKGNEGHDSEKNKERHAME